MPVSAELAATALHYSILTKWSSLRFSPPPPSVCISHPRLPLNIFHVIVSSTNATRFPSLFLHNLLFPIAVEEQCKKSCVVPSSWGVSISASSLTISPMFHSETRDRDSSPQIKENPGLTKRKRKKMWIQKKVADIRNRFAHTIR